MIIKIAGYDVLIDDEDFDLVSNYKWYVLKVKNLIYFRRIVSNNKHVLLHREITNAQKGVNIDHVNGNTLDNRKCNLRVCTTSQNAMNCKNRENNKSGYKGVSWDANHKKWQAKIMLKRKTMWLGYFTDAKDAYKAYCNASKEYHGEYGRVL